jgi:hypothetical protein
MTSCFIYVIWWLLVWFSFGLKLFLAHLPEVMHVLLFTTAAVVDQSQFLFFIHNE